MNDADKTSGCADMTKKNMRYGLPPLDDHLTDLQLLKTFWFIHFE